LISGFFGGIREKCNRSATKAQSLRQALRPRAAQGREAQAVSLSNGHQRRDINYKALSQKEESIAEKL